MHVNSSNRLYDYLGKHGGSGENKSDDVLVEKKTTLNGKPMLTFERVGNKSLWQSARNLANGFSLATPEHVQSFLQSRGMSQEEAFQATSSIHRQPGAIRAVDFEGLLSKYQLKERAPEISDL